MGQEPDTSSDTATTKSPPGTGSVTDSRLLAAQLVNQTWQLLEQEGRTEEDDAQIIHTAHASRYHWGQVLTAAPVHLARGDFDLAFAYEALARASAVAGDADRAREYTDQALAAAGNIADGEDHDLALADLETIPGQPRYW